MELIYVWIEKHKNIEKCSYPLNKNFEVDIKEYTESVQGENCHVPVKEIAVKRLGNESFNFGGNIKNVSILVGENGTGKSNFLTCIADPFEWDGETSFICIYVDNPSNKDDTKYIFEICNIGIKYEGSEIKSVKDQMASTLRWNGEAFINEGIRVQQSDTVYMFIKEKHKGWMFSNANGPLSSHINRFGNDYRRTGFKYQLRELLKREKEQLHNNQNKIKFSINLNEKNEYKVKVVQANYPEQTCGFDSYNNDKGLYKQTFILRFLEKYLHTLVNGNQQELEPQVAALQQYLNKYNDNTKLLVEDYSELAQKIKAIKRHLRAANTGGHGDIDECYDQFISVLNNIIEKLKPKCFRRSFECEVDIALLKNDEDLREKVEVLFDLMEKETFYSEFIRQDILNVEFSNLSEGERYLMTLYSTMEIAFEHNPMLYLTMEIDSKDNQEEKYPSVILVLDEPDAHFHPEWSRLFISELLDFLNDTYSNEFQIIISTHSPFIISDVPNSHVLKISKEEYGPQIGKSIVKPCLQKTFGANIHTLLNDSFFMKATIGELAREKINKVTKMLATGGDELTEEQKEQAREIIEVIGEPIIKNRLKTMYNDETSKEDRDFVSQPLSISKDKLKVLEKELESTLKLIKKMNEQ